MIKNRLLGKNGKKNIKKYKYKYDDYNSGESLKFYNK